jgi:hypothetical protein
MNSKGVLGTSALLSRRIPFCRNRQAIYSSSGCQVSYIKLRLGRLLFLSVRTIRSSGVDALAEPEY